MQDLKVTLIQSFLHWENAEGNLLHFENILQSLRGSTDLIILPEMFTTGFSTNAEKLAEEMDGRTIQWMRHLANEINTVITGSLIIHEDGKFFNRLIWMRPDGTYEYYDKRHLFGLGDEHKHYSAGNKKIIVSLKEWNICPLICYDLRFPVWCRNRPQTTDHRSQYDLLLFVANWPQKRSSAWKSLLQARAMENQTFVAGVNRIGNDGKGDYHSGDSALIDPLGEVVFTQTDTAFAKTFILSKERLQFIRKKLPFFHDADDFQVKAES